MPTKQTGAENVRWDLSQLYDGPGDARLGADIDAAERAMRDFKAAYRGRLAELLGDSLDAYTAIEMLSNKVMVYLFLRNSTDQEDDETKARMREAQERFSLAAGECLTFYEHEIVGLSDGQLDGLAARDPRVAKHRPWLDHVRIFKPHLLSEQVEEALTKRSPFGSGAWAEFFDEVEATLRVEFKGESKTLTEMLDVMNNDPDRTTRAEAMKAVNDAFGGFFVKYSAQTLNLISRKKALEDRERGYPHPMASRNMGNMIPDEVVEALHAAVVHAAAPLARRYYRLKAAHLGLERLAWSDRNAPMPFADTTDVPFDEAVRTVVAAYESFSPTLASLVEEQVEKRRIDAPAVPNKSGGAYNYSIVLPDGSPVSYTFLNYLGTNRDVMTIAHELGHAVHGLLAGEEQGALMQHAPMAYAETASVFGEMTTFNYLKARLESSGRKEEQLALVMDKLDDIINTMVRQIGFSNFERRVHGAGKHLSVDELNAIWLATAQELYGPDGEVFTYENTERLWSYVGHFHRPFYVYAYAFGELLTQSLYAARERFGDRFEGLYLDMLRAGSTKDVIALLEPFGLDPRDEDFWAKGIEVSLGALIAEAEALSRDMGVNA